VCPGDAAGVTVGANSNVQDDTVINTWGSAVGAGVSVGENVTIGHGTVIAGGCSVGNDSFIGMYSILGADVVLESNAMTAAGAVVAAGTTVPAGEVWAGNPAKKMKQLDDAMKAQIPVSASHYAELASTYK